MPLRDWSQESFPLSQDLVREIFRDAAVLIGKSSTTVTPAVFCQMSLGQLNLDRPPIPQRPNLQRKTMFYNVQILLAQTGTWVLSRHFSETGWLSAPSSKKIEDFAADVLREQAQI